MKPELVVAEYRRLYPQYSAERRVLRRDDCRPFLARRGHRSRRACAPPQGSPLRLPARLALSSRRRQVGRLPHARHPAGVRDAGRAGFAHRKRRGCAIVSSQVGDAFLAFARAGDPNHAGLPQWRPYQLEERATMMFDPQSRLVNDPARRNGACSRRCRSSSREPESFSGHERRSQAFGSNAGASPGRPDIRRLPARCR